MRISDWSSDVCSSDLALRASQHLDILKIEGVENYAVVDAEVDAIEEHADRRIDRGYRAVDPESADREIGDALEIAGAIEGDIGRRDGQVPKIVDLPRLQLRTRECQIGSAHV